VPKLLACAYAIHIPETSKREGDLYSQGHPTRHCPMGRMDAVVGSVQVDPMDCQGGRFHMLLGIRQGTYADHAEVAC
jgi:hypothetical protein